MAELRHERRRSQGVPREHRVRRQEHQPHRPARGQGRYRRRLQYLHLRGIERQLRHKELFTEILALPRDSGGSADSSPRSAHTYNKNRPLAQHTEEAAEGKRQDTRGAFGQVLAPHSRQALGRRQPRGDEGHSRSEQDRTSRTRGGSARRSTARTRRTAADAARGRCGGL